MNLHLLTCCAVDIYIRIMILYRNKRVRDHSNTQITCYSIHSPLEIVIIPRLYPVQLIYSSPSFSWLYIYI